MRASRVLFRYSMVINLVIIVLGFWAPWIQYAGIGSRILLLEWLALEIGHTGLLSFTVATPALIVCGALVAATGSDPAHLGAQRGSVTVWCSMLKDASRRPHGRWAFPLCAQSALPGHRLHCSLLSRCIMPATGLQCLCWLRHRSSSSLLSVQRRSLPHRAVRRLLPGLSARRAAPDSAPAHQRSALRTTSRTGGRLCCQRSTPSASSSPLHFLSWTYDTQLIWRAIAVTFGLIAGGSRLHAGAQANN